jgi:hypothetical protein
VAPGGVELVEPIWSWPSSSLAPLCGVSRAVDGMATMAGKVLKLRLRLRLRAGMENGSG